MPEQQAATRVIGSGIRLRMDCRSDVSGAHIHDVGDHGVGGQAISHRVVDLADDRDLAIGQALAKVQLPHRRTPVERHAADIADHLLQITHRAFSADVVAEEVPIRLDRRLGDQQRVIQAQRDRHDPTPHRRQQPQPLGQLLDQIVERVVFGWFEYGDLERVHVHRRRLHVQEAGVKTSHPHDWLHQPTPGGRAPRSCQKHCGAVRQGARRLGAPCIPQGAPSHGCG